MRVAIAFVQFTNASFRLWVAWANDLLSKAMPKICQFARAVCGGRTGNVAFLTRIIVFAGACPCHPELGAKDDEAENPTEKHTDCTTDERRIVRERGIDV